MLDKLKGLNAKAVKNGLATFDVPKGSTLTRREIITRCTNSNVHVVSVARQLASAIERQQDLEAELRALRSGEPEAILDAVRNHARTRTSLQRLARLQQAIADIRKTGTGDAARPATLAAGDARLVDTMRLIDRHIEWIDKHGIELPGITADAVVEKFDWHGDTYAASSRLVRAELLQFYRSTFRAIAGDARVAAERAHDQRAKAHYRALCALGESLAKVVASKTLPRR